MEFKKLFARDTKGGIKEWSIEVIKDNENNKSISTIITRNGLVLGKKTVRPKKVEYGKNIGRGNETTPYEQACSDAQSKYNKKLRGGYKLFNDIIKNQHINIPIPTNDFELEDVLQIVMPKFNTDKDGNVKPMLAYPLYKTLKDGIVPRIKFPAYGQRKFNGVRCIASFKNNTVSLVSREGTDYNVGHVKSELLKVFKNIQDIFDFQIEVKFDGELYIHNTILSDIVSAVKSSNMFSMSVVFNIYDLAIPDFNQRERLEMISRIKKFVKVNDSIRFADTFIIPSLEEAERYTDRFIDEGYEGAIYRTYDNMYKFGSRSSDMVKMKRRESAEFKILSVVDTVNAPELAMFVCQNDITDGTFEVVPQGTHDKRREYYLNADNCIGKMLTVEFYERTKDDLPFHATGIVIRDYE
jgi:hypothetical protein